MAQDKEVIKIDFFDGDGNLKDKETYLKEMDKLYDNIKNEVSDECHCGGDFLTTLIPNGEFEPQNVLDKYQFIERKLYLDTEIIEDTGRYVLERIQFWNAEDEINMTSVEDRIPIQIYIDSPGGLITTSFLIIDAIQKSKTPVITIATGTAYSAAFFILIAGHKRQAFPNATFLFHEGSGGTMGDAHKVLQQADFYERLLKQVKRHILKTTKITDDLYEEHRADDWYFNTKKALKLGVIDSISNDVNGGIYDEERT